MASQSRQSCDSSKISQLGDPVRDYDCTRTRLIELTKCLATFGKHESRDVVEITRILFMLITSLISRLFERV